MGDADRLAEIRSRLDAVSAGPWVRYSIDFRGHRSHSVKTASGMVVAHTGYGPDGGTAHQDAELIVNAYEDLRYLLDEVARLERANTQKADALAWVRMVHPPHPEFSDRCKVCGDDVYPCPTVRATQEGWAHPNPSSTTAKTEYGYKWLMPDGTTQLEPVSSRAQIPPGEPVLSRTVTHGPWTPAEPERQE